MLASPEPCSFFSLCPKEEQKHKDCHVTRRRNLRPGSYNVQVVCEVRLLSLRIVARVKSWRVCHLSDGRCRLGQEPPSRVLLGLDLARTFVIMRTVAGTRVQWSQAVIGPLMTYKCSEVGIFQNSRVRFVLQIPGCSEYWRRHSSILV